MVVRFIKHIAPGSLRIECKKEAHFYVTYILPVFTLRGYIFGGSDLLVDIDSDLNFKMKHKLTKDLEISIKREIKLFSSTVEQH